MGDLNCDIDHLTIGVKKEKYLLGDLPLEHVVPDPLHGVRRIVEVCLLDCSRKILEKCSLNHNVISGILGVAQFYGTEDINENIELNLNTVLLSCTLSFLLSKT